VKARLVMLHASLESLGASVIDLIMGGTYLVHDCLADVLGNDDRDESVWKACCLSGLSIG
jgi:hypothetical protein